MITFIKDDSLKNLILILQLSLKSPVAVDIIKEIDTINDRILNETQGKK